MSFTQKKIDLSFSLKNGNFGAGGNSAKVSGLRVSATIVKPGGVSMGTLEAAVWGLPLSMMNQLSTIGRQIDRINDNKIIVEAGDAKIGMHKVFEGTIFDAYVDAQSMSDTCFRITANAGGLESVKPVAHTSVDGSGDAATMIETITKSMGMQFENNGVQEKLSNPYYAGAGLMQIQQIAQDAGFQWLVDNGKVSIWKTGSSRGGNSSIVAPPPKGRMVGYPAFRASVVFVRTEFDPTVEYGRTIQIDSDITPACGTWIVNRLEYHLESIMPKGDWFCNIQGVPENTNP